MNTAIPWCQNIEQLFTTMYIMQVPCTVLYCNTPGPSSFWTVLDRVTYSPAGDCPAILGTLSVGITMSTTRRLVSSLLSCFELTSTLHCNNRRIITPLPLHPVFLALYMPPRRTELLRRELIIIGFRGPSDLFECFFFCDTSDVDICSGEWGLN